MSLEIWAQCNKYFLCEAGLKSQNFTYNVGSLVLLPPSCSCWKPRNPSLFHLKSYTSFEYYYICDFLVSLISNVFRNLEAIVTRCLSSNIIFLVPHVTPTLLFSPQFLACSYLDLVDLCRRFLRKAPGPKRVLRPTVHDISSWFYGRLIAIKSRSFNCLVFICSAQQCGTINNISWSTPTDDLWWNQRREGLGKNI